MNFRRRNKPEVPGFQLAPMIDIIFNLLAFFIAAQIFAQWESEIDIKLPTAQTSVVPRRLPGEVIVNVLKDGSVIVNRQKLADAELQAMLHRLVSLFREETPILIRADKGTDYEHIIKVLDFCRVAGIWNISFATSQADGK